MDKEIDSHKLMFHPERVAEWHGKGDCPPIYIEIGLTNLCNHKCSFCGLDWARGQNTLKTDVLFKNLEDMSKFGVKSICFSGAGEPLLHKDFLLIIKKTKELGIDVSFSTNVVLFNEKIAEQTLAYLSWIRFSLDSATAETHSKLHGTSKEDFPKIINNLKKAVEIKRKNNYSVILGVQFLLLDENKDELLEIAKICRDLGVDNLQIKPYSQNPNSVNRISVDYSKFRDFEDQLKSLATENFKIIYRSIRAENVEKGHDYKECFGLPFFAIINEKGNVAPCHQFYDLEEFSFGNIYDNLFSEIWLGKKRQEVIQKINKKGVSECKKGCRLHEINKYLHRLRFPNFHDNFI